MFTSKQRSILRSIAQTEEPIGQIGKGGISENMVNSFSDALGKREIIKVTVLNNNDDDKNALAIELAEKLNGEVVAVIGHKIIIYRYSNKKGVKHLL